jgi:ectoine hydroxylase-related dioxygenase (phytanoyl-CoA dioxygenase family)
MNTLTIAQKEQFEAEGYLVVEDVLDPAADLRPVLDEYAGVLEGIAQGLFREGAIKSTHAELPLIQRLIAVCVESGRNFPQHFDFSLPLKNIRRDTPIHLGPAIFAMLTNPRLLDVVEDLIGPEIYCNPVQHVRFKLPQRAVQQGVSSGLVAKIPWHQDNGVILPEADAATILTVWIPLTPATARNSCLQVVPGSHRRGLVAHCPIGVDMAIPDRLVATECAVTLPMKPGSALLMTQQTMHTGTENVTEDDVRISMDLRYQPIGQPSGRPAFAAAGFNARSRSDPGSVLTDPAVWARRWLETRERLADNSPVFNRWRADSALCA